jgi:hypothetical protein
MGIKRTAYPQTDRTDRRSHLVVQKFAYLQKTTRPKNFRQNEQNNSNTTKMKKVTGIGGIFFKCKDPNKMKEWYKTHLGLDASQYGASFEWREDADPTKKGTTQWNPFAEPKE